MAKPKLCIKDKVIDIKLIRDLSQKFSIVKKDNYDVSFLLEGSTFIFKECDEECTVDFSHWLKSSTKVNIADLIIDLANELMKNDIYSIHC